MGADTFFTVATGKDAKEAFNDAVEQAQYDYGHAGYTGTIAEKVRFVHVGTSSSKEEAFAMANEMIENCDHRIDDKWGPAGCIEFLDKQGHKCWLFFGWASS